MSTPGAPGSRPRGGTADRGTPGVGDGSLSAVQDSDRLVDALAARSLSGSHARDPLARVLHGWVGVIDAEVEAATAPRPAGALRRAKPPTSVAGVQQAAAARAVPVTERHRRRPPWRALSASAAAVITVLAVGAGLQDLSGADPRPDPAVAQSVESIEATLLAARAAVASGDAAEGRQLLERAHEMVAGLPSEEQEHFTEALGSAERVLQDAERAGRGAGQADGDPADAGPAGTGQGDGGESGAGGRGVEEQLDEPEGPVGWFGPDVAEDVGGAGAGGTPPQRDPGTDPLPVPPTTGTPGPSRPDRPTTTPGPPETDRPDRMAPPEPRSQAPTSRPSPAAPAPTEAPAPGPRTADPPARPPATSTPPASQPPPGSAPASRPATGAASKPSAPASRPATSTAPASTPPTAEAVPRGTGPGARPVPRSAPVTRPEPARADAATARVPAPPARRPDGTPAKAVAPGAGRAGQGGAGAEPGAPAAEPGPAGQRGDRPAAASRALP